MRRTAIHFNCTMYFWMFTRLFELWRWEGPPLANYFAVYLLVPGFWCMATFVANGSATPLALAISGVSCTCCKLLSLGAQGSWAIAAPELWRCGCLGGYILHSFDKNLLGNLGRMETSTTYTHTQPWKKYGNMMEHEDMFFFFLWGRTMQRYTPKNTGELIKKQWQQQRWRFGMPLDM